MSARYYICLKARPESWFVANLDATVDKVSNVTEDMVNITGSTIFVQLLKTCNFSESLDNQRHFNNLALFWRLRSCSFQIYQCNVLLY